MLNRLKRLPVRFWAMLLALFGFADFLTWSVLSDVPPSARLYVTLAIVAVALVITLIAVLRQPTSDEVISEARMLFRLARREYEEKRYREALALLESSVRLDKASTAAQGLLGRSRLRLGLFEEAIHPLSMSIETTVVASNRRILRTNRAICRTMLGEFGIALHDIDANLSEEPNLKAARRLRSIIWLCMDRPENALEDISIVLNSNPEYLCGYATKAVIEAKLGDIAQAREAVRKVEELLPEDADDFYCAALAYSHIQQTDEALSALEIAIQQDEKYLYQALFDPMLSDLRSLPNTAEMLKAKQTEADVRSNEEDDQEEASIA